MDSILIISQTGLFKLAGEEFFIRPLEHAQGERAGEQASSQQQHQQQYQQHQQAHVIYKRLVSQVEHGQPAALSSGPPAALNGSCGFKGEAPGGQLSCKTTAGVLRGLSQHQTFKNSHHTSSTLQDTNKSLSTTVPQSLIGRDILSNCLWITGCAGGMWIANMQGIYAFKLQRKMRKSKDEKYKSTMEESEAYVLCKWNKNCKYAGYKYALK